MYGCPKVKHVFTEGCFGSWKKTVQELLSSWFAQRWGSPRVWSVLKVKRAVSLVQGPSTIETVGWNLRKHTFVAVGFVTMPYP